MERVLGSAQAYASTAKKAHGGEAADAFDRYFKRCVGFDDPPPKAQSDETLVANLVAACLQIAKACDRYADHVEDAKRAIVRHKADIFASDNPFNAPMFGGNGYDGGLNAAVTGDPHIHALGSVAHALDSSQARIRLPAPPTETDRLWNPPVLPPLAPAPAPSGPPMVPASFNGPAPGLAPTGGGADPNIAARDPIPPDPNSGHTLLSIAEQKQFRSWRDSLPAGGFAGGGGVSSPDKAYQLKIAGYPERDLALPPEAKGRSGKGLAVDGMRPSDGYLVEAKHVRNPNCENPKTFRSLDAVKETLATEPKYDKSGKIKFSPRVDGMYGGDERELRRYQAAMDYPPNKQVQGLEIVTNDKGSAAYWQSMLAMTGVKGDARYVQ